MTKLARALMALFFFCALFCAAESTARATTITIPSQTVPNFQARGSGPVFLRIFLNRAFVANNGSGVAGTPLQPSSPSSNNYYLQLTCTLVGTTLTIPSFTIDSTTDGLDINTATYSAYFFDATGAQIGVYAGFEQFRVPYPVVSASGCSPAGTCATWADLRAYNFARVQAPDNSAYTKSETLALINANLAGQVPITSPFWLKTPVAGLTNSVALSTLATGLVKNTTGTGQPSIAAGDVDYQRPISVTAPLTFGSDTVGLASGNLSVGSNLTISAGSGTGAVIGSGFTLSLGPNVVTQVTNDSNIQGTIASGNLTFSWGGTLAKNRNLASAVYTDQSNTFGNFVQTFQAGANFLLTDPAAPTKQAQFILSNITAGQVRQVNIPDVNSTAVVASTAPANQFATAVSGQGAVSYASAVVASSAPANQFATAISAAGALSYAQPAFSNLSGTAAKAQLPATAVYTDQANTFGNFLQKLQAGTNLSLVDPADTTKTAQFGLSNITTGQTRTVNVPDANSTTVQSSTAPANQFATGVSGQGVVSYAAAVAASTAPAHQFANAISAAGALSYAQPTFADISGSATKAQAPATAVYTDQTNAYSAGLQDLSAVTLKVPVGAGLAPTASGLIGYDSTANDFVGGVNGATRIFADTSSAQTLANKTLTQPSIADFTNAAHNHSSAAAGGQLTLSAFSSTTGSGAVVGATSPALVTPSLGAATATTINKYTFTQPASGATLTIADGKTVTFSNTFTFNGTDGATHTFPNNSGTVAELNLAQTWSAIQTLQNNALNSTTADGGLVNNTTAATNNQGQVSPAWHFQGAIFDNSPPASVSKTTDGRIYMLGQGGNTAGFGPLAVSSVTVSPTVPAVVNFGSAHGFTTGTLVTIAGTTGAGSGAINRTWYIRAIPGSPNSMELIIASDGTSSVNPGAITNGTGNAARAAQSILGLASAVSGAPTSINVGVWNSNVGNGGIFVGSQAPLFSSANLQLQGNFYQTNSTGGIPYTQIGQGASTVDYFIDNFININGSATGYNTNNTLGEFAYAVNYTPSAAVPVGTNHVAFYPAIATSAASQQVWAINPLVQINNTMTGSGAATVGEFDMNTSGLAANAPDPPAGGIVGQVIGITITGLGSPGKSASAALLIGGSNGLWKHGVYITGVGQASPSSGHLPTLLMAGDSSNTNIGYGLDFQGTSFQSTGSAIRIPNSVPISGRNAGGSADVPLIQIDANNYLRLVPNTSSGVGQGSAGYITGGGYFTSLLNAYFQVEGADGVSTVMNLATMGSITNPTVQSGINFLRGRGGSGAVTNVQANDIIGQLQFRATDETGAISGAQALIRVTALNNWSSVTPDRSTFMDFYTTQGSTGSNTLQVRIQDTGKLQMIGNRQMQMGSVVFASLAGLPNISNGDVIYCSDCKNVATDGGTAGSVAVAGGTGTFVWRVNNAWRIFF